MGRHATPARSILAGAAAATVIVFGGSCQALPPAASDPSPAWTWPSVTSTPASGGACTSELDGTYTGLAAYEFSVYEYLQPAKKIEDSGPRVVELRFVLQCESATPDQVQLKVTRASASDAYFGALDPVEVRGSATLPRKDTLTATTYYQHGFIVEFPNGAVIYLQWLTVRRTASGIQIASDPGADGRTPPPWDARKGANVFPEQAMRTMSIPKTTFHAWSLTRAPL